MATTNKGRRKIDVITFRDLRTTALEEFRPLLRILEYWGLAIDEKKSPCWGLFLFLLTIFSTIHYVAVVIYIVSLNTSVTSALDNSIYALSSIVTCCSIWHFRYSRRRLRDIFKNLPCLADTNSKYIVMRIWINIGFAVSFLCAAFSRQILNDAPTYASTLIFEAMSPPTYIWANTLILIMHQLFRVVLVKIPEGLLYIMYCSLCSKLRKEFVAYKRLLIIRLVDDKYSPLKLKRLIGQYWKLCQCMKSVDNMYSPLVIWWFLSFVSLTIFNIYDVTSMREWDTFFWSLIFIIFYSSWFLDMTLNASAAMLEARKIADFVSRILLESNSTLNNELLLLYLKMVHEPPQLTGWNAFVLSKGLVLTVGSMVLTYLMLIYQFK